MKHKNLGFQKEGLIQMEMTFNDREGISREISSLAVLKGFTQAGIFTITHEPYTQNEVEWEGKPLDFNPNFQVLQVGSNFSEVLDDPDDLHFGTSSASVLHDRIIPKQMEQLFLLCPYRTRKRKSHDQSNPEYIQKTL